MVDAPPSFGGLAVDPPTKVKKKAPRKPRSECTPEEVAKLYAESAKRRERRAVVKVNAAAAKFAAQRDEMEAARRKAGADEKEDLVNKAHAILMLGMGRPAGFPAAAVGPVSTGSSVARPPHYQSPTSRTLPMSPDFPPPRHDGQTRFSGSSDVGLFAPSTPRPAVVIDLNVTPGSSSGGRPSVEMQRKQARAPFTGTMSTPRVLFDGMPTPTPTVDGPFYNQYMEDVIFEGGHGRPTTPRRPKVRMAAPSTSPMKRPSTVLTTTMVTRGMKTMTSMSKVMVMKKKAMTLILVASHCSSTSSPKERKHKKKRKSIRTGSYTQDEDKLICQAWMEIS